MIDEKRLIEEIWKRSDNITSEWETAGILNLINQQPKVGKWIPCSERLPEEHDSMFKPFKGTSNWDDAMFERISDDVNVTIEYSDGKRRVKTSHTLDGKWGFKKGCMAQIKAIAWQPLPEPYKENADD